MAHIPYQPLSSKTATRFLSLHPGHFDDHLTATVKKSTPYREPYEAISYTLEPPHPEEKITINLVPVRIRKHLANCLRHIRYKDRFRRLWVDAISISQFDIAEKNQQVENIGRIFREANLVLAWIGLADEHSEVLFRRFNEKKKSNGLLKFFSRRKEKPEEVKGDKWTMAVTKLIMREYWSRRWIIQELILARKVRIICGVFSADWDDFMAPLTSYGEPMSSPVSLRNEYQEYGNLLKTRSLIQVCSRFQNAKCYDPRDKIYALLQLTSARGKLRPDYSKPVEHLFLGALIVDIKELEALVEEAERPPGDSNGEGLLFLFIQRLAMSLELVKDDRDVKYREHVLWALYSGVAGRWLEEEKSGVAALLTMKVPAR